MGLDWELFVKLLNVLIESFRKDPCDIMLGFQGAGKGLHGRQLQAIQWHAELSPAKALPAT
jgi:hypothetical protein